MTARLILARHGNTFGPNDKPVWVGARSDLPLVEKGLRQAQALADALQERNIMPDAVIAGPLRRTRRAAAIVAATLHIPQDLVRIDARLREIDYGAWEGKSTDEIIAAGDGAELAAWDKQSVFPITPGWKPSENEIAGDVTAIMNDAVRGLSLVITSNGILRFFARAGINAAGFADRKVATGNICVMDHDGDAWRIICWNQPPERFLA